MLTRAGLGSVMEPSLIIYSISSKGTNDAITRLEKLLPRSLQDEVLVQMGTTKRVLRMKVMNDAIKLTVGVNHRPPATLN